MKTCKDTPPTLSHRFISPAFSAFGGNASHIFSTHPTKTVFIHTPDHRAQDV